jgi:hypothetical protein
VGAHGTSGRASLWASASDDDDEEMSVDEDDSEAEEQAENSRRDDWTKVEQLRRADTAALDLQNAASRASMRLDPEAALSTCVSIYPQDISHQGIYRFEWGRGWRRLVRGLKPIEQAHFKPYKYDCCYQLTLKFSTTQQAKQTRDRFLEGRHGGDWPPFAVSFASPWTVRSMELPVEAPPLGREPLSRPRTVLAPPPAQCPLAWLPLGDS